MARHLLIERLVGIRVTDVRRVHDYVQIEFETGSILSVFNRYEIRSGVTNSIRCLVGATLLSCESSTGSEKFRFSDGVLLTVGLADSDYRGPEAITLMEKNSATVVW